jgi:pimeloyl-ACP methyl ester carboxylesterase
MTIAGRTLENREVQRSEDTTIRYTVSGPAGGPTVVLIHGWACSRADYDAVTGFLPDGYRVIAVDLAEHGESRSTRPVWTMREFANDVVAAIAAESVEQCVVVGHSLGGAVAVEVGRLLPDAVTRIGALEERQAEEMMRPAREDFAGLVRSMVEAGSPAGTSPALKDAYFERMVAVRQPAGTHAFEGLVAWNMEEALDEAKQPITLVGVRSLVSPDAIDRLGERVDIMLVDLGSHHFHREAPEGTARVIADVVGA